MKTILHQLAPHIRTAGVRYTARGSGIDPAKLSRWLNGKERMSDKQIERIAHLLDVKIVIKK